MAGVVLRDTYVLAMLSALRNELNTVAAERFASRLPP